MEHTTFAKKTVVLAALGALSLMAATVRADETETEPTPVNIAVEIGATGDKGIASTINNAEASVTWDDEWLKKEGVLGENQPFGGLTVTGKENADAITVMSDGSLKIAFGKDANQSDNADVTFKGVNLAVNGGAFANSSNLTFSEGGSFTVEVANANAVEKFKNAGTITLVSNASMKIGSAADTSKPLDVTSDDDLELNVGNVEIKSGTLTNYDKGYQVKKDPDEKAEGEAGAEDATSVQTLVKFGQVTVAGGGQFVNADGALSEGSALILEAEDTAVIGGTSVWENLQISKVAKGNDQGVAKSLSDYVEINGDFRVTDTVYIEAFDDDATFTLSGKEAIDSKVLADGVNLSFGSHVSTDAFESVEDQSEGNSAGYKLQWTEGVKHGVGTVELNQFDAVFEEAPENPDATEGKAEGGEDQTKPAGSWTYKKFGSVTATNTVLVIDGARPDEDNPYGTHGYTPSMHMSSLNLVGTSMKIAYDADVEKIQEVVDAWVADNDVDKIEWTDGDVLEQIDSLLKDSTYEGLKDHLDELRQSHESVLAGDLGDAGLDVESTISGSDLVIDTLSIRRNSADKNYTVKVEKPAASTGDGQKEGTDTPSDEEAGTDTKPETVTITGDKTYDLGSLSLTVTDS